MSEIYGGISSHESFLYVFHCDGFHKVGISRTPMARMKNLQAMNPHPLTLVLYRRVYKLGMRGSSK